MSSSSEVTHVSAGAAYPPAGRPVTAILIMVTVAVLAVLMTQRIMVIGSWRKLTAVRWYILVIYFDSFLFVFSTGIISMGFGVNSSLSHCSAAIIMCIIFYETTKVFIYLLLVEKVRLVKNAWLSRRKDKLYLFNSFGVTIPYTAVCFLTLAYRFSYFDNGVCRIGMRAFALIPLVSFDVVVNVYLTTLFLIPVINISRGRAQESHRALRRMAVKTFFGSCATLISSVANLTTLLLLKGEPGWICLLLCNADVLFSCLVLHAITNKDHQGSNESTRATNPCASANDTVAATELPARRDSCILAKPFRRHSLASPNAAAFIGPQLSTTYANETLDPLSEKSPSVEVQISERKTSRAWTFGKNSRTPSSATEVHFDEDIEQTAVPEDPTALIRPEGPRMVSMPLHVRPITEYAEYDSDGLDFITKADIAEDVSSDDIGEHNLISSDDDIEEVGRNGRHEERFPHKLV